VPAHDERDFAFAKKYHLPIKQVIAAEGQTYSDEAWQEWYGDKSVSVVTNSGKYDGLRYNEALEAIAADLGLTRERVRQIQGEALSQLRRIIKRGGVDRDSIL